MPLVIDGGDAWYEVAARRYSLGVALDAPPRPRPRPGPPAGDAARRGRPPVSLRYAMTAVEDQGDNTAACVVFCVNAALEYFERRDLSEQYTLWRLRQVLTGGGMPLAQAVRAMTEDGTVEERHWAYTGDAAQAPPAATVHAPRFRFRGAKPIDPNDVDGFEVALSARIPVMCGLPIYPDCGWDGGWIALPSTSAIVSLRAILERVTSRRLGGHAILLTGFDPQTRRFEFKNSWGADWGHGGYGSIPYDYLARFGQVAVIASGRR